MQALMQGIVVRQAPEPPTSLRRWDPVAVWVEIPEDDSGVREPRVPPPLVRRYKAVREEPDQRYRRALIPAG
jgi:hypothetical protein